MPYINQEQKRHWRQKTKLCIEVYRLSTKGQRSHLEEDLSPIYLWFYMHLCSMMMMMMMIWCMVGCFTGISSITLRESLDMTGQHNGLFMNNKSIDDGILTWWKWWMEWSFIHPFFHDFACLVSITWNQYFNKEGDIYAMLIYEQHQEMHPWFWETWW